MNDLASLKATVDEWNKGLDSGDIERMIATCDPDVVTCNNNVKTKIGIQAIRDKYNPLIAAYHIKSGWEYEHIRIMGDTAVISGFFEGEFKDKKTNDTRGGKGRLVIVYRRGDDGSWKMVLDMDNN